MQWSYDEIESFVEQLCNRLNVPVPHINIGTVEPTCFRPLFSPELFTLVSSKPIGLMNINPKCRFSGAMPLEVVIAHELKHWEQYFKGDLKPGMLGGMLWQGNYTPYIWHRAPWELDAVTFENEIALEFGYPILRFIHDGSIFELNAPTGLNAEQKQLALDSRLYKVS